MDINGENALKFFGKMTASISHELKNVLAIINENAGLLEDLCAMAERGRPVDPDRIKTVAGKVIKQVKRGDEIIIRLNSFAHTADESVCDVDLCEAIKLVSALSGRLAMMREITVELNADAAPVVVNTNPFLLETLVWLFLDFAMDAAGEEKRLSLSAEMLKNKAIVRFSGLKGLAGILPDKFPGEREKALLLSLNATAAVDPSAGEVVISFAS
jgi:C4-dicarboxylate-specific signal transduction histidine kinase